MTPASQATCPARPTGVRNRGSDRRRPASDSVEAAGAKKATHGITLPDVRRLLQAILTPHPPANPIRHAMELADWRQGRSKTASDCHKKARKRTLRSSG